MKYTKFNNDSFYIQFLPLIFLLLVSCQNLSSTPHQIKPFQPSTIKTSTPIKTLRITPTLKLTATEIFPSPTFTTDPGEIPSSPLENIDITELSSIISNEYNPPTLGSDGPHQGVDFSILDSYTDLAVRGNPVRAVLGGVIASVLQDRFPYGNAVVIETQVELLHSQSIEKINFPTPAPVQINHPVLTCPKIELDILADLQDNPENPRSLYILYAHLEQSPSFQQGAIISQGQVLGRIGSSGNALNPHLHLEIREGQSGFHIPSMAHYHPNASTEEMTFYCIWRISNAFQLIDPMTLFIQYP